MLRYAELPVVSNDLCYATYGDTDKSQICLQTDEVKASSCSVRSPRRNPFQAYTAAAAGGLILTKSLLTGVVAG